MIGRFAFLLPWLLAASEEWPGFRGPNLSGVSPATGLPVKFDAATNFAWRVDVPTGRSSPIVSDHRLFISASSQSQLMVLAFDTTSSRKLWEYLQPRSRRSEFDDRHNDPASSTPATDGQAVYVFFPDFGLIAISVEGKELWRLPLDPFVIAYGMGTSPVVSGDTVFLQCDQTRNSYLLAVHKKTGKVKWRVDRTDVIDGWSSPLVLPGREELIALSSTGLAAFDRDKGSLSWSIPASDGIMIPVPVTDGKVVIATIRGSEKSSFPTWEDTVSALDTDKDGRITAQELEKRYHRNNFNIVDHDRDGYITELEWNRFRNRGVGEFGITAVRLSDQAVMWRQKRGLPYSASPVLYRDLVFSVRDGGIIMALDVGDGQIRKEFRAPDAPGIYLASPVAADGKVYFASTEGKITVVKATADLEVLAVNDLGDGITATPAITDRAIFVRTHGKLYCFRQ